MKNINVIKVNNLKINYKSMKSFRLKSNVFALTKKREMFTALQNVTFNVKKGQVIGVIGRNGSGKSTLLKTISGIFSPDEGKVDIGNNTVSLLSIGLGFKPELSGYENIYLSGLLLGFTKEKIKEKAQEIIDFSELDEFIFKPVRTYSSGMYSKLAFSISALLDTDILLIDEVLSVGDMNFREKSYKKIREIISDESKTIMIVSHSLDTIREICDKTIWLEKGKLIDFDVTSKVLDKYVKFMEGK